MIGTPSFATVLQEARLPEDKLQKCHTLLSTFYSRRKVTLKELRSLIGLLNFTCSVILPGRAFLCRLIDLTIGIQRPYHRIRFNKDLKADLKVRIRFLAGFNSLPRRHSFGSSRNLWKDCVTSQKNVCVGG